MVEVVAAAVILVPVAAFSIDLAREIGIHGVRTRHNKDARGHFFFLFFLALDREQASLPCDTYML